MNPMKYDLKAFETYEAGINDPFFTAKFKGGEILSYEQWVDEENDCWCIVVHLNMGGDDLATVMSEEDALGLLAFGQGAF